MSSERPLSRRRYLALAGAGLSALAGCGGSARESGARSPTSTDASTVTATPPPTNTPSPTETPTATPTPSPTDTSTPTPTPTEGTDAAVKRMETRLSEIEFRGEYFDTHAHWLPSMGPKIPAKYAPAMEKYGVGATVLFSPSARAARDYESFLESVTGPGVEYLPFMSAPPPGRRLGAELRELYDGTEDAFWGIGEWKPQNEPFPPFDSKRYTPLWELSADLDIPVMFHPKASQEGTVEPALKAHPETTFILHGHQMLGYGKEGPGLGSTLPRLLREYDNLYWQMDVGVMLSGILLRLRSSAKFVTWYESNASGLIEAYRSVLPELLAAAPKRVLWGTDIAQHWNLNEEAFGLLIEFTEKVLEAVPEKHHAPYKRGNALRLFGI